jgi:serine/threonine protein kinase
VTSLSEKIMPKPLTYEKTSESIMSLMKGLLDFDPSTRLSAREALRNPVFD